LQISDATQMSKAIYWSSTEQYSYSAVFFYFDYMNANTGNDKNYPYHVRAVRAF